MDSASERCNGTEIMNATSQALEELASYVQRVLPDRAKLTRLEWNPDAGVVELTWSTRQFVVRPSLATYEVRGRTLMVTAASTLLQSTLQTKDRHAKILGAVIEAIRAAEDNLRGNPEMSLALLDEVRNTLLKLARKPVPKTRTESPAGPLFPSAIPRWTPVQTVAA